MIQFLIDPSLTNERPQQTHELPRYHVSFDKRNFKNDLDKIDWKEHYGNQIQV